jgi:hypothetical protein
MLTIGWTRNLSNPLFTQLYKATGAGKMSLSIQTPAVVLGQLVLLRFVEFFSE